MGPNQSIEINTTENRRSTEANPESGNDSPAANAENDLRQGNPETPQEPAL
jgi:hypothetical protein